MKAPRSLPTFGAAVAVVVAGIAAPAAAAPARTPASAAARTPVSPTPAGKAARSAAGLVASRPAALHASAQDTFAPGPVQAAGGLQYVPYQRTHGGLAVVGGDFVVVTDADGRVVYTSVALKRPIGALPTGPKVGRAVAEAVAGRRLHHLTRVEGTRLVVDALGATARLAWESTVAGTGADGPSRLTVDVDATTGTVLHEQEHVLHGSGTAVWNGPNPVALDTTLSGGTYAMRDPAISNLSCQNASGNTVFTGPDDLWGSGNANDRETGCVDALFGAQTEARMLSQWLGRNAMDGSGGAWPIRVGLNDLNAFYDGSQVQIGHNRAGQWIGAIDVIAHEMGHGVDDHTPGGISRGGTQEFVADAFGAATEWFANEPAPYDVPDFTVGEQINLTGRGPIRNMANPAALGHPNCYSSAVPTSEVHSAAGPGNHWFYLLAEGSNPTNGQPTSPTCNSSQVGGIGVRDAIRILYGAMLMKNSPSSYLAYRTWTLQAAKNLFPTSCEQFNAVKAAWDAVSVPAQGGDPTCGAFELAFQANTGSLWTVGADNHGAWGLGMMPGTNPSIANLAGGGYEVAFQANTGNLWTAGTAGTQDWGLGMMKGSSPAITALPNGGYVVAFEANTTNLWTAGSDGVRDWGLGMMSGTSPAITTLTSGGYEIAFQANTTSLWTVGSDNHGAWDLGMATASSPAIAAQPGGGYVTAFEANTTNLWIAGSPGVQDLGLGMWAGTSPAVAG